MTMGRRLVFTGDTITIIHSLKENYKTLEQEFPNSDARRPACDNVHVNDP